MKIGLDLDEVTADFMGALLKFYHLKRGKLHTKEEFKEYKWWPVWGMTREEAIKLVDEFHDTHNPKDISPMEHAIESINNLIDKNEIIIITARPSRFRHKVEAWLSLHLKNKLEVLFAGDFHKDGRATKAQICKEKGISLLLEDSTDTALECANSGIKVILFDKPWNQGLKHKNIIRVKNWLEAMKEISRLQTLI